MQLISDHMNVDHRHCDAAFALAGARAAAGDWAGLARDCAAFLRKIERHIEVEEGVLFPAFEQATGMTTGPTETMCMEHEQMRAMFAQMRAAIAAKDTKQYLAVAETLLALLQQHNMKEESMMYPMLDQALGEGARDLLPQLQSLAA